jgi:hypothetical protein
LESRQRDTKPPTAASDTVLYNFLHRLSQIRNGWAGRALAPRHWHKGEKARGFPEALATTVFVFEALPGIAWRPNRH